MSGSGGDAGRGERIVPPESLAVGVAPERGQGRATGHGHGHGDDGPLPPGWSRPKPEHVPRPTYWPAVAALGVTFLFWGLVTTLAITVIGLIIFGIGLAGWIGALRHGE